MTAKEILLGGNARTQLASGLNAVANVVKVTLGSGGRNVVLDGAWGTLEVVEGMQFDRGYLSPYFVTDPRLVTRRAEDEPRARQ